MNPVLSRPPPELAPEFDAIDRHFADFISERSGRDPAVQLAAALVSHVRGLGHICLDLHALKDGAYDLAHLNLTSDSFPASGAWMTKLRSSPAVGAPGAFTPLILEPNGRLYLQRYWQYEANLAASLKQRARLSAGPLEPERLAEAFTRLFPSARPGELDWQMVAAFAALRRRLCVISGGPGTGKTRTVVVLLALLLEQKPGMRIALAAPTGKAAARLQESIKQTKVSRQFSDSLKQQLPEDASTIHRLLGAVPDSAYFRHHADNLLPVDIVVVDEASMVDLALMAKLVAAMPPAAQLILLGDKDQLASVEAGAVLADICGASAPQRFSPEFCTDFEKFARVSLAAQVRQGPASDFGDCIVELRRNYRFGDQSRIFQLSRAVNNADTNAALRVMGEAAHSHAEDLRTRPLPAPGALKEQLTAIVLDRFRPYLTQVEPGAALAKLGQFRILSPLRGGPYGVENLNLLVEEILREAGLISGRDLFYAGRPIMVTRNDYSLKLFNGDIGLIQSDRSANQLRAWFPDAEGKTRGYLPLRLPVHETAFALTVHKSQGSEFERVLLILPNEDSPVLTRELVYTGLTRASVSVEAWFTEDSLRTAVSRRTLRRSGLREALWEG